MNRTDHLLALSLGLDDDDIALANEVAESEYLVALGKLDRSPGSNWVQDNGGLPRYIEEVADSLHRKRGMTISRAIATAVSQIKKWAVKSKNADTKAKAVAAVAQWNALKARAKAKKATD